MNGGLAEHCSFQGKVMNDVTLKHRKSHTRSRLSFIPSSAKHDDHGFKFETGAVSKREMWLCESAHIGTTQDYLTSNFSEDEGRSGKVK